MVTATCCTMAVLALTRLTVNVGSASPQSNILRHPDAVSIPCPLQEILEAEVARFYRKLVVEGTAFGELCHPGYTCETYKELHLAAVSHQASKCRSACGWEWMLCCIPR